MRILCISDVEEKALWDYYQPGRLDGYDLILAAGDLDANYLEFIATFAHCPVLYVPGNHDHDYEEHPPFGCRNIDGRLVVYKGVRILGLGGSMRYRRGPFMYTEQEMRRRVRRLWFDIHRRKGFDILLTHSPALGLNDGTDLPHTGFACFGTLIDLNQPSFHVYGHMHKQYTGGVRQIERVGKTRLINASGRVVIELPDREYKKEFVNFHGLF